MEWGGKDEGIVLPRGSKSEKRGRRKFNVGRERREKEKAMKGVALRMSFRLPS